MDTTVIDSPDYNISKENPEFLLTLLNKYVKVDLIKNVTFLGYLLAIDPEQYNVVLSVLHGDSYRRVLIPGHAILDIRETAPQPGLNPFINTSTTNDLEDVSSRKQRIISWLKKNLLPVSESGENIILGNASILPPYGPNDVCTDNPIVANQIKGILMKVPDDFEPS